MSAPGPDGMSQMIRKDVCLFPKNTIFLFLAELQKPTDILFFFKKASKNTAIQNSK